MNMFTLQIFFYKDVKLLLQMSTIRVTDPIFQNRPCASSRGKHVIEVVRTGLNTAPIL